MKQIIYSSLKLLLIISFINALHSCRNTCEPVCCGGDAKSALYYTALSESDGVPLVFELSEDLSEIKIIRENARIFSPPAENDDFCYSRENSVSGKTEIFLANLNDFSDKNITENLVQKEDMEYAYPVISPTGGSIAINSQNNWLFMYSYSGGLKKYSIISSSLMPKSVASFSPDGSKLAFFSGNYPDVSIYLYDVANESGPNKVYQLNNIIDNRRGHVTLNWSDDSRNLCFAFDEKNNQDTVKSIYLVDLSGSLISKITNTKLGFQQLACSPANENEILFVAEDGNIWLADRSSEDILFSKLTDNLEGEVNANPNWSHDAQKIVYTKFFEDSKDDSELYVLDVNTKSEILISNQAFSAYWRR